MRPADLPVQTPPVAPVSTLRGRWHSWRDRLLASRRFQRWAAGFIFTRPIARARARSLFDLVAGFVYSQVLLACVQLRLFDILSEGPQTLAALSTRLALSEDAAQRLLSAAISLELVERRGPSLFGLGALGAAMVGNTAIAAMVEHHVALYADLADPVALLRGQARGAALASYWPYAGAESPGGLPIDRVADYSALMSASQPLVADEVLDAYSMRGHRCLLDVGGGEGGFLISAARRHPGLRLMLFDLPAVAERAERRFAAEGLADRAQARGGDFLRDALPSGADIVSLVRVVHDHDDARVLALLKAVHRVLPAHGCLLLAEPMAGTPGAEPMGDAYFGFYLLAMGRGKARTAEELTSLLHAAGFGAVQPLRTRMPLQTRLLLARPASVSAD